MNEKELDRILGDFAVENSREDEVLMSIDAVENARNSIMKLIKERDERLKEEIREMKHQEMLLGIPFNYKDIISLINNHE